MEHVLRIFELRQKEVINCADCQILGSVCDVDIDIRTGRICSIIVPGPCKVCGLFGRDQEYVIDYGCIRQIGADVILVDIDTEKALKKCDFGRC